MNLSKRIWYMIKALLQRNCFDFLTISNVDMKIFSIIKTKVHVSSGLPYKHSL